MGAGQLTSSEGGPGDSYTVVLDAEPSGTVTIVVTPDAQLSGDPMSLIFTTSTWSTPQTVDVSAADDVVVEGIHEGAITYVVSGGGYDGVSIPDTIVNISDNDAGSVRIGDASESTEVVEGGRGDSYTVVLGAEPSGTVTIVVTPAAQLSVDPLSLIFTTSTWSILQTVDVSAEDDVVVEGVHEGVITHVVDGGGYDGVPVPDPETYPEW